MKNPDLKKFTSKTNLLQFQDKKLAPIDLSLRVKLKDYFHFMKVLSALNY